jgi:hypothetical protein
MTLVELLRTKSSEHELVAELHAERAPLDDEHAVPCHEMAAVGIVLREVEEAIDVEWGEEADVKQWAITLRRARLRRRRGQVPGAFSAAEIRIQSLAAPAWRHDRFGVVDASSLLAPALAARPGIDCFGCCGTGPTGGLERRFRRVAED